MGQVQIEKRKRGPFGWVVAILFWGFNIMMAVGLWGGMQGAGEVLTNAQSDAERAGAAIGTTMGVGVILFIWVLGVIILGMMMLFTRGKKVIVTQEA